MADDDAIRQWDAYAHVESEYDPVTDRQCLDFLRGLAGQGRALDLGPGTGRITIPLAQAGTPVTGIELAPTAAQHLKARAQRLPIDVMQGDMSNFDLPQQFTLAYATWSTLFALTTQEAQVNCFDCVAQALQPGGTFVVDVFAPLNDAGVLSVSSVQVREIGEEHVDVVYTKHRPREQRLRFGETRQSADGNRITPIDIRYAWPSELDLMAQLAGLTLTARYADWNQNPYTWRSFRHVSVYTRLVNR